MADVDKGRAPSGRASPPTAGDTGDSDVRRASGDTSAPKQALDETKRAAQDLAGRAKEQGRSAIEQQKHTAAEQVDSVAHAFRRAASQLQQDEQSSAGQYVDSAAQRLESFAQQLRQKDLDSMLRDVEDLGRRSPVTLFAGSLAAGFLISRFLKSSRQSRHEHQASGSMTDEGARSSNRSARDGAFYGEYASDEWSGSNESLASELGMAASSLPESNTGSSSSTVVRSGGSGDRTDAAPSSPNESKPGGNNYGNR
ncbi:MAG TPA: hypothetical protein VFF81_13265 [Noviherbaspirillum sp.]|nr:hypothetical protein [Noviherbaspirillum sp.]